MREMLISNIAFAALIALYLLWLKRMTFFSLNRVYLLSVAIFSLLLPLIQYSNIIAETEVKMAIKYQLPLIEIGREMEQSGVWMWIFTLYFIGFVISLSHFIHGLYTAYVRLKGDNIKSQSDAFTIFKYVHVDEGLPPETRMMIHSHEMVHATQNHTIHLLIYAILRVVWWFNPFVYIAFQEVSLNHEFLADEVVLKNHGTDYQHTLLNWAMDAKVLTFAHGFQAKSQIKNRIVMMNKKRTAAMAKLSYAAVIPVAAALIWMSSCAEHGGIPDQNTKEVSARDMMLPNDQSTKSAGEVDQLPQFPGGHDRLVQYFQDNFIYPERLKEMDVEGTVYVAFVVNTDGSLAEFDVEKSTNPELEQPALDFLQKMPSWIPGKIEEKPVKVRMVLPVKYSLS